LQPRHPAVPVSPAGAKASQSVGQPPERTRGS
jgi:hypothetical protein